MLQIWLLLLSRRLIEPVVVAIGLCDAVILIEHRLAIVLTVDFVPEIAGAIGSIALFAVISL